MSVGYTAIEVQRKLGINAQILNEAMLSLKEQDPSFGFENKGGTFNYLSEDNFLRLKEELGKVYENKSFSAFFFNEQKELEKHEEEAIEKVRRDYEIQRQKLVETTAEKWNKAFSDISIIERAQHITEEIKKIQRVLSNSGRLDNDRKQRLVKDLLDFLKGDTNGKNQEYHTAAEIFAALPEVEKHWEPVRKYATTWQLIEHNGLDRNQRGYRAK